MFLLDFADGTWQTSSCVDHFVPSWLCHWGGHRNIKTSLEKVDPGDGGGRGHVPWGCISFQAHSCPSLFLVHHETNNPSTISHTMILFCLTMDCRLQSLKPWVKTILPASCFSQGFGHRYSETLAEFVRTQHHSQEGFGEHDIGLMLMLFSPETPF